MEIKDKDDQNINDNIDLIKKNQRHPSMENLFISRQQYQYTPVKNNNAVYINEENNNTRYIPEEDESADSVISDSSGNLIDTSGNSIEKKYDNQITYKKYTYKQVEKEFNDDYFDENEYHSSALDILATYLRGQKLIYMESKAHCEHRLNYLMILCHIAINSSNRFINRCERLLLGSLPYSWCKWNYCFSSNNCKLFKIRCNI